MLMETGTDRLMKKPYSSIILRPDLMGFWPASCMKGASALECGSPVVAPCRAASKLA